MLYIACAVNVGRRDDVLEAGSFLHGALLIDPCLSEGTLFPPLHVESLVVVDGLVVLQLALIKDCLVVGHYLASLGTLARIHGARDRLTNNLRFNLKLVTRLKVVQFSLIPLSRKRYISHRSFTIMTQCVAHRCGSDSF